MRTFFCTVIAAAGLGFVWPVAHAANLADSKAEFEKSLAQIDATMEEQRAELQSAYVRRLREIEAELETQGHIRSAVSIFDEISRTLKTRALPAIPAPEPVEMRDIQMLAIAKGQQLNYSNELEVVHLASRYIQFLAQQRSGEDRSAKFEPLDEERERVLILPRLRTALKTTSGLPPDIAGMFAAGTNVNGDLKFRVLKLVSADTEELTARLNYDLQVSMAEDDSRIRVRRTASALSTTLGEDGIAIYRTRFLLGARGENLPAGSRLVATYYSRSLIERERRRENSETIALPPLSKGESYSIEGQGLAVSRSYANTQSTRGYASVSAAGNEWYGVVVELQAPDGRVILRRYSPQSLERELARDAEKTSTR